MKSGTQGDRLFDKRVVRRNIREGRATQEDYQAFLAALPDRKDHIKPRDEGGDDDGYDARHQPRAAAPRPAAPAAMVPPAPESAAAMPAMESDSFADAPQPAPAPRPPTAPEPLTSDDEPPTGTPGGGFES